MNRRALLLGVAALPVGACTFDGTVVNTKVDNIVALIVTDGKLLVAGLKSAWTAVAALPQLGIPSDVSALITAALDGANTVVSDLGGVASAAQAKPLLVQQLFPLPMAFLFKG